MAFSFGNLIDKASTLGRKYLPPVAFGKINPFYVDYGISELFNGGQNTANTGQAPINARVLQNLFSSRPETGQVKDATTDNSTSTTDQGKAITDAFSQALAGAQNSAQKSKSKTNTNTNNNTATHFVTLNGQQFNLDDAGQKLAYHQAVAQELNRQRDLALSTAQSTYGTQIGQAGKESSRALSQIDQALADNAKAAKDFVTSHLKTVNQFNQSKGQGDVQRAQNFASLSPNAFQSSQGTSQDFANTQYLQGIGDLAQNAQNTVGLDYVNNPDNLASLDQNSALGRQNQSLTQQRGDVNNSYQNYLNQQQKSIADYQNSINASYTGSLDANSASLANSGFKGSNPYTYSFQNYQPIQTGQVDLSKYTPYTNTASLTSVPQTGGGGYRPVTSSNPFTNQSVSDQYLGRTNTNLTSTAKDQLNKYLLGKTY